MEEASGIYSQAVQRETATRIWINNPSAEELRLAIDAGAIAGTTNPAYGSKLLSKEPDYMAAVLQDAVQKFDDDRMAADAVYQTVSKRFMEGFEAIFEASEGQRGFVTMQDDPRCDHTPELIVEATHEGSVPGAAIRHSELLYHYPETGS